MTHSELIRNVAGKIDIKPEEAAILLQQTGQILAQQLAQHQKVRIKNFGALVIVKHKSRTVPDPRQMTQKLVIFDQFLPKFRPSEQLRQLVKEIMPKQMPVPADELVTAILPSELPPRPLPTAQPVQPFIGPLNPTQSPQTVQAQFAQVPPAQAGQMAQGAASMTRASVPTAQPTAWPVASPTTQPGPRSINPIAPTQTAAQTAARLANQTKPINPTRVADLAKPINIGYVDLSNLTIDKSILELVPFHLAKKYQLVPIEKKADRLVVAMIDPGDREAIELVARQTGLIVEPNITTLSDLQHIYDQYGDVAAELNQLVQADTQTGEEGLEAEKAKASSEEANEAPAAKVVTNLLERAVREKASDVHIEPQEKNLVVRFRIDGLLQPVLELPKNLQGAIISRLKILSNLKIDETRLPQDGRIRMTIDQNAVDFRLSTLPAINGEKIVMRILDKSAGILSFAELGLDGINLQRVVESISKAHGMTLITGPTGSGKTTSLYAMIGTLMKPEVNIVTLEDPVEYRIPGINQSQTNQPIGYDFASGLRSIVRQDPDIILIGEIRDLETATMAIHSALTGHVVLSTLHTNDAAGALPRMIDMGIEPFLITSSTNAIIAQRLVRRICDQCKGPIQLPEESLTDTRATIKTLPLNLQPKGDKLTFYKGQGCSQCHKSGYSGRLGIFETLLVSEPIKQLALKRVSASELTEQAIKEGMITLKQDGVLKALAGVTTLEEVWRVTKD